jgi:hypothetical protein
MSNLLNNHLNYKTMFELEMSFTRSLERQQESSDEGVLQIVGITIVGNEVNVNPVSIDLKQQEPINILDSWPNHHGTNRNPVRIGTISADNPYFAYVIRAIECDNSNKREEDLSRFVNSIEEAAQASVTLGNLPGVNTIWVAGNEPKLNDRKWRDDDDIIGVSARVYPDYGTKLAEPNATINPPVSGSVIPGGSEQTELLFNRDGASWRIGVNLYGKWS